MAAHLVNRAVRGPPAYGTTSPEPPAASVRPVTRKEGYIAIPAYSKEKAVEAVFGGHLAGDVLCPRVQTARVRAAIRFTVDSATRARG